MGCGMTSSILYRGVMRQLSILQFIVIFALSLLVMKAHAETVSVSAFAVGRSQQDAVDKALIQAIEQVTGVRMEAARVLEESMTSVNIGENNVTAISESFRQAMQQKAGGLIRAYQILAIDPQDGGFLAKLNVDVERFSAPGLPTQDRRRIIVVNPYDYTRKAGPNAALLRDQLISFLVQSRRFAVLDRDNDPIFKRELDLLRGQDVPVQETMRIGQMLGTDYIVLLKIRDFETQTQRQTVRLTGKTFESQTSIVSLDFSVFEVATRQIKWTGRVADPQESDLMQAIDQAAIRVGEDILNAIYPLLILQTEDNGTVVINQGGETIRVGQQLSAFRLGEQMIDPYTKEPLGRAEIPAGIVVIERVDPKLSYGRVVGAAKLHGEGDLILRKTLGGAMQSIPAASTPQPTGNKPKW